MCFRLVQTLTYLLTYTVRDAVVAGDAAVSETELEMRGGDGEETRTGTTPLPAAAQERAENPNGDIQGKSAHRPSVNDSRTRSGKD